MTRNQALAFAMTGCNTPSIKLTKPTGEQAFVSPDGDDMNGILYMKWLIFLNSLVSLCDMDLKGAEQRNCVCKNANGA